MTTTDLYRHIFGIFAACDFYDLDVDLDYLYISHGSYMYMVVICDQSNALFSIIKFAYLA